MAANAEMYPELTPQVTEVLTVDGWVHFPDASVDTPRSRPSSWEWHAMWRMGCDYGCDAESASPISWERAPGWDSSLTATSIMSNSRSACFAVIPIAVAPKRPSIARQDSMYLRAGSGPNLSRRRGSTPTPATTGPATGRGCNRGRAGRDRPSERARLPVVAPNPRHRRVRPRRRL